MNTLFIDIETIPCQQEGAFEEIKKTIQPPGNIKKLESIEKWIAENADAAAEEKWRKTALDGSKGELFCIGFALNNEKPRVMFSLDESILLRRFYQDAEKMGLDHSTIIVGHNVRDFDLRFLFQRSVINGVQPTFPLHTENRYSDRVYDTMQSWAGWGNRISLANLCAALSIPVKDGDITGATVWDAVRDGRADEVCEYCRADVEATREVYKRMTFKGEV